MATSDARPAKRQRLTVNASESNCSGWTSAWDEGKERLRQMDARSIDEMAASFESSRSLAPYDAMLWYELQVKHFGAAQVNWERIPEFASSAAGTPARDRGWDWTSSAHSCQQLRDFLRSYDESEGFGRSVRIIRGDLRTFGDVEGTSVDGIIFPADSRLRNTGTGAAGAVFERAGEELSKFVDQLHFFIDQPAGSITTTPGYNAGVKKLIHCVGAKVLAENYSQLLYTTYENAMKAVLRERLQCVALASLSAGTEGVLANNAAEVGLRAIQRFLRSTDWNGNIYIVCDDEGAYETFKLAKQNILDKFNVTPLYLSRVSLGTTSWGRTSSVTGWPAFGTVSWNRKPRPAYEFAYPKSTPKQAPFGAALINPSKPQWFRGVNGRLQRS